MKRFSSVAFDLDGTLIDTEAPVLKTWAATLDQFGHRSYTPESLRGVLGVTNSAGLAAVGAVGIDLPAFAAAWAENYRDFAGEAVFFPGAERMLDRLKAEGFTLGAVTSRNRREFGAYFTGFHLERWMSAIVLEEDTIQHKPEAEPLCKYLELTGASAAETIYIGDMPTDIRCAKAAGTVSGFVRWNGAGFSCPEADLTFDHMDELLALLTGEQPAE